MVTDRDQSARPLGTTGRWALRHWAAITLVVIAAVYGGAVTLLHGDAESPIDETVYLDYAYKAWTQGIVHQGEEFGADIAHRVACDTVIPFGPLGQQCGSDTVNLGSLPNAGYTTGAAYTPVYFWIVRTIGDPIHALSGISLVSSWRLSGVLWLAATVLLLSMLLRRSGVSQLATLTLGLLFIGSPYVWWTYTYLSTDASVVLFGAAVLLVTMEARRRRLSAWWLLPLGLLAPIFKITNLLVFGVVVVYLLIDMIARSRSRRRGNAPDGPEQGAPRRVWLPVTLAVVVAAAAQFAWMRIIPMLAVSDVVVDQGISARLTLSQLVGLAMSGVAGPITHNPMAGFASTPLVTLVYTPLSWIAIASVIGALMVFAWDAERGPIIWATAIGAVVALPALAIVMWVMTHSYFPLPARYGAALIPAVLLVGGFMFRNRFALAIALAYSGVLIVYGVGLAIHVGTVY